MRAVRRREVLNPMRGGWGKKTDFYYVLNIEPGFGYALRGMPSSAVMTMA